MAPTPVVLSVPNFSFPLSLNDSDQFAFTRRVLGGKDSLLIQDTSGNERLYSGLAELYRFLKGPDVNVDAAAKKLAVWYRNKKKTDPGAAEQGKAAILAELEKHEEKGKDVAAQLKKRGVPVPEEPKPFSKVEGVSVGYTLENKLMDQRLLGSEATLTSLNNARGNFQAEILYRLGEFHFSSGIKYESFRPYAHEAAEYRMISPEFGLMIYEKPSVGRHDGFHIGFFGDTKIAFSTPIVECVEVKNGECPHKTSVGFDFSSKSPLIMAGVGGVSGKVFLYPLSLMEVSEDFGIPSLNRNAMELSLTYYLEDPTQETKLTMPEDVFKKPILPSQLVVRGLQLFASGIEDYYANRGLAATALATPLVLGDEGQYNSIKLNLFMGSTLSGFRNGNEISPLTDIFLYGDTVAKIATSVGLAAELGIYGIIIGANGGIDPEFGNPDGDTRGPINAGGAYLTVWPKLFRNAMAGAEAIFPFYDYNKAIQAEEGAEYKDPHFMVYTISNLATTLGGCIGMFYSGDDSGSGFLNKSILGNERPDPGEIIDLRESRFSLQSSYEQGVRATIATSACTHGVTNLIALGEGIREYRNLTDNTSSPGSPEKDRQPPQNKIGFNFGISPDGAQLSVSVSN